ncbi:MAG: thiamine pyrophosphate-dependent enzyme [Candidatus Omnitrophota bacterium]|nr:thiamine pyrophosphate-dependent enzyme [Candidatus Omnitrophota bacterium]
MANLRELSKRQEVLTGGHRMCAGCGAPIIIKQVTLSQNIPLVVGCATGCLEVSTTVHPFTAWKSSFIHCAFENSAATVSGAEAAYKALKRRGKIKDEFRFLAVGGDGGTYDIGLQSLSGMLERGHRILYVCYNNEAYMNTGVQRSGATPKGAQTTTAPIGKQSIGKKQYPKDLTAIVVAHRIPFVAQASPSHWNDLITKSEKAFSVDGPAFMNVISPCPLGWAHPSEKTIEVARLAVDTCFWPLFEVENGTTWKLSYKPAAKKPITEYFKAQARFRHLLRPENAAIVEEIQERIDEDWVALLKRCGTEVLGI